MPQFYFAIDATLAALKNVETVVTHPPHVLPQQRIPLLGPVRKQTLDKAVHRVGSINVDMQWDLMFLADLNTFILTEWGDYLTASKALYASWLDESGHYSPFSVTLERPVEGEHYTVADPVHVRELRVPGYAWTLQSVTKTSNYSVTTSDRLIYVDTSGGSVTLTLPAAASMNPYTVFSFVKTSASNNLVLDGNGAETIDGAATKTLTALNVRADLYSTGSAWISL